MIGEWGVSRDWMMQNHLFHTNGLDFIIDKWVPMKGNEQDKKIHFEGSILVEA